MSDRTQFTDAAMFGLGITLDGRHIKIEDALVTDLYIAGEQIHAGDTVVISFADGKAYRAGPVAGVLAGNATEEIREGFRIAVRGGVVTEDDA